MAEPKVRFKKDDGSSYPAWAKQTVGEMTVELTDYKPLGCGLPLLTSSRTGLMFQEEFRGKSSTDNEDTLFSVVPRGAVTYRHMSDDDIFHFNINDLVDAGLVSKEYPVFNTVNGNNIRLLVEYLNSSNKFLEFCKAQKKGGTRTRLYFKVLKDFEIMCPCVEEQQKIADFLSSVDDVISTSAQEVANLETQKKAVMKKIFSQEVRFKRADGSDFPEWEAKPFEKIATLITASIDPSKAGKMHCVELEHLEQGSGQRLGYVEAENQSSNKRLFENGDVLFGKLRPYLKKYWAATENGCCSTEIWVLRPVDGILSEYLLAIVSSEGFISVTNTSEGTKMPRASWKLVANAVFPVPSSEEQHLIADLLFNFDEAVAAAKKELELWKKLKKGLLQQMFV